VRVRFGECVFDAPARVLTRAARRVTLTPRAFDLLEILLARRPQVVPQAELRDQLWPRHFVAYTSLARLVTEVRRAIGDTGRRQRFVRTVYGRGYAFTAEAVDVFSSCTLVWVERQVPLLEGENLIGRGDDCHVRIASAKVSRHHARISVDGGTAILEDLGSKNGTFVGSDRVEVPRPLRDGDEILVGTALLRFHGPAGTADTETASVGGGSGKP
jgi:DNA-binding winged helix-turn-helix (wHTH) protein